MMGVWMVCSVSSGSYPSVGVIILVAFCVREDDVTGRMYIDILYMSEDAGTTQSSYRTEEPVVLFSHQGA